MNNVADRLKRVMSYSEIDAVAAVYDELGTDDKKVLVNKTIADKKGIARSVVVTAFRLLEVAGVVETKSLGAKGTFIKVLDRETLQAIVSF